MKKLFYLLLCAVCIALVGCKDNNQPTDPTNPENPQVEEDVTMTSKVVQAHTIYEVTFKSGEKMWFGVENEVDAPQELSLVSAYAYYVDKDIYASNKYKGDFIVPSSFKCKGTTYTVTGLYGSSSNSKATPFYECEELTSLTIPSTVLTIGAYSVKGCSKLTKVVLPESIKEIGGEAFRANTLLVDITLPASLEHIGYSAFYGCKSLKSIVVPSKVDEIGRSAFNNCENLTGVVISNGVKTINEEAFRGCVKLQEIELPASITKVGLDAFLWCESLMSLTCLATTPPSADDLGLNENVTIYVPASSVDAYKGANGWKDYNIQPIQ